MGGLVGDEFVPSERLVIEGLISKAVAEFLETTVASTDQSLNLRVGESLEVIEEFGDRPYAGESSVFCAGPSGEKSAFEYENFEVWVEFFQGDCGAEANNSGADDGDIDLIEVG